MVMMNRWSAVLQRKDSVSQLPEDDDSGKSRECACWSYSSKQSRMIVIVVIAIFSKLLFS